MLGVLERLDLPNKYTVYGRVMRHANLAVRLEALSVIGRSRSEQCRRLVLEAMKDEQPQLRIQAATLLPRYDPARGFRDLMDAVRSPEQEKRGVDEKIALYQALGATELPEALDFFREQLGGKSLLHRARVKEQKMLAAAGLGASPSIASYKILQAEFERPDHEPEVKVALQRSMNHVRKQLFGEAS
jgi:HEAT repeat protein